MFNFFEKQIIVNDDSQVVMRTASTGALWVDNDVTKINGEGIIFEGFLGKVLGSDFQILSGTTTVRETLGAAGVTNKKAYVVNSTAISAGEAFRITEESLDLTPTEFQNRYTEKRYQASTAQATNATVIAHIVATINADPNSSVIAYAGFNNVTPPQDDSDTLVLVAKNPGTIINLYPGDASDLSWTAVAVGTTVYHTAEDTNVVTANGALPVNTYDYLKNVNWAKNFDIDRNLNWMPLPGVTYNGYYFEVNGAVQPSVGSEPLVSQVQNDVRYGVKIYAATGTTLATNLLAFAVDMNA